METQHQILTETALEELLDLLNLPPQAPSRRIFRPLLRPVTRKLAKQVVEFDRITGEQGFAAACHWLALQYVRSLNLEGQENIPPEGPLLVVANHPGVTDFLCLFAGLNRPDLKVITGERRFLRALPNTSPYILYIDQHPNRRMVGMRAIIRHLQQGGMMHIFPTGRAEPDPAVLPGILGTFANWSRSLELCVRQAPDTLVVPALITGTNWHRAVHNPLAHAMRTQREQIRMGSALQFVTQMLTGIRPVDASVTYLPGIPGRELLREPESIVARTSEPLHRLILSRPALLP